MSGSRRLGRGRRLRGPALGAARRAPAGDGLLRRRARARARAATERRAGAGRRSRACASRRSQQVRTGSFVEVPHDPALRPAEGLAVSTWIWLAPGAARDGRRALVASWGPRGDDGWALVLDRDGRPCFEVAAQGRTRVAVAERALPLDSWWRLEGVLDPTSDRIAVSRFDRSGNAVDGGREAAGLAAPGPAPGPLLIGAERRGPDAEASAHLDGKLEQPTVSAGPGGRAPGRRLGVWARDATPRVRRPRPAGLHGRCVNGPLRAVTGRRWSGDVHDWRCAAEGYEAMHFHSDAVDDLGWEPTLELEIDEDCASGVYAVILRAGGHEDVVPFVVRPAAGAEPAAHAVLLPTFTYLAYSCERGAPAAIGSDQAEDRWVASRRLRSLYDRFDDGCGVYEASLLRPLTQLRPGYRCPQHGGPHGLAQDLILLGFLERRGLAADLLTDHDLHAEGAAALAGHRAVITGAHPEYATAELLDALETHVDGGRRPRLPRRQRAQRPRLGRSRAPARARAAPQRDPGACLAGAAGRAPPRRHRRLRRRLAPAGAPRAPLPRGRAVGLRRGARRLVRARRRQRRPGGGDRSSPGSIRRQRSVTAARSSAAPPGSRSTTSIRCSARPPTPPCSPRRASAPSTRSGPTTSATPSTPRRKRRADIVLRLPPAGGTVFSVGSIAWSGCLGDEEANPIARITENVLRELARERPFEAARG